MKPTSDTVHADVDELLSDSVVTSGVVISGIFFPCDQLLRVEESLVSSGSDFVDHSGLQVDENRSRNVFSSGGFAEESVEAGILDSQGCIGGHQPIGLDPMLETVEFPAGISDLASCLAYVEADNLTLKPHKLLSNDSIHKKSILQFPTKFRNYRNYDFP